MKFKTAILGLLGGAMLALPMTTTTVLADPAESMNPNYVQKVDWWWDHYGHDHDSYVNHGWHSGYYEYGGHKYACDRARGLQNQVWQDRQSGHPAAAHDVAEEAASARARCYNQ